MKASVLSKAGRNDEALQEYFLCVALKPDWTKVKLEAQKVKKIHKAVMARRCNVGGRY